MDDPKKIKKIIKHLNDETDSTKWEEAEGYHAFPSVTFKPGGEINVNMGQVSVVKLFINHETGELKSYFHKFAAKDENDGS